MKVSQNQLLLRYNQKVMSDSMYSLLFFINRGARRHDKTFIVVIQ